MGGVVGIQKDKLGSPSTGSEDGGGVDLAELVQELDHDEFDGPTVMNGIVMSLTLLSWLDSLSTSMFQSNIRLPNYENVCVFIRLQTCVRL